MKYETYTEYDPHRVGLAESAFLTVWSTLGQWHDSLVLIGGHVPKYLCGEHTQRRALPRPSTLDVDLGIALAADSGQYGNLLWELQGQGFKPNPAHPSRFEKVIGGFTVPVDFLVEKPPHTSGTTQIEDITAHIMPGVERALATARQITVSGVDLHGARQELTARVCEVGPFLALKLRAFCDRQQPKDAFDILYTLRHYDGWHGRSDQCLCRGSSHGQSRQPGCPAHIEEALHCGDISRPGEGQSLRARSSDTW